MEARTDRSITERPSTPAASKEPPALPPSTRRPRVREVSSRFMSPVSSHSSSSSSTSSAGDLHVLTLNSPKHYHQNHHQHQNQRSISAHRQRRQLKMGDGDDNRSAETARSLDSPFPLLHGCGGGKIPKNQGKPLKENSHRPNTPTPLVVPPSRSRLSQQRLLTASAATRLLQSSGMSSSVNNDKEGNKENSKSSASDALDLLPTVSNRNHTKFLNNSTPSPLYRSLSSPMSSCDDSYFLRDNRGGERVSLSLKNGAGSALPPVPPNSKLLETKKQRKALGHLEDAHSLKLLHNRYLQWRFANAKAEIKTQAQKSQAERMIYSLRLRMMEMCDSVQRKQMEFQTLSRVKALLSIVESQTPSLEEWSGIEEEYSTSLTEVIEALLNASFRLPLSGNIKVDVEELEEALGVATKLMEGISQHVISFIPKAEDMESLISELARITTQEKTSIEECGMAFLKTQASQIEEWSLRSEFIQYHMKKICCKTVEVNGLG